MSEPEKVTGDGWSITRMADGTHLLKLRMFSSDGIRYSDSNISATGQIFRDIFENVKSSKAGLEAPGKPMAGL